MAKRLSNNSNNSKIQFKEPSKDDDNKSVTSNNDQSMVSKSQQPPGTTPSNQQIQQSQVQQSQSQSQPTQPQNGKFDLPQIPKFQSLPLRDYFDAKLSTVLLEGLKEIGRVRPDNPTKFLGEYLIKESSK